MALIHSVPAALARGWREKKPQKDLIFLNGREIIIISDKSKKKEIVALNFFFSGRPQNDSFVIQSQRLRVQRRVSLRYYTNEGIEKD